MNIDFVFKGSSQRRWWEKIDSRKIGVDLATYWHFEAHEKRIVELTFLNTKLKNVPIISLLFFFLKYVPMGQINNMFVKIWHRAGDKPPSELTIA